MSAPKGLIGIYVVGLMICLSAIVGSSALTQIEPEFTDADGTKRASQTARTEVVPQQSVEAGQPAVVSSNMFDIRYRALLRLKTEKNGGGLWAENDELLLVAGDGQLRILNLSDMSVSAPGIELPDLGEAYAVEGARRIQDKDRSQRAIDQIRKVMRFEDILVVSGSGRRYMLVSYTHFDSANACFSLRVSGLDVPVEQPLSLISADADEWELVYSSEPCFQFQDSWFPFSGQMAGGRMEVDGDTGDTIFLTVGDYSFNGMWTPAYP